MIYGEMRNYRIYHHILGQEIWLDAGLDCTGIYLSLILDPVIYKQQKQDNLGKRVNGIEQHIRRVKYVKKKNLTATQLCSSKSFYMNHGHYGTGIYEMNDDPDNPVGRQDIKWADVNDDDLVIVQTPDTNRLAMGGIPIETNIFRKLLLRLNLDSLLQL